MHTYLPETWDAQVNAGLINDNSGIHFCQSIDIEDHLKFNNLADKNGFLYQLIKETGMPFYIDRLQGGSFIEKYPYNMELVQEYKNMLGDNFFGFQMHEWMSNYTSDIQKLIINNCNEWTAESITKTIFKAYPYPHLFLESMNAEELATLGKPESFEEFLNNSRWLFNDRQKYTDGYLLPCDSCFLAYNLELKSGVKRLMPEIGAQTLNTRIQVAYARGMTKAYGTSFGTYYEPWGGSPFSACCYQRDGKNEWNINSKDFPFETCGENGGSSRSLQWRMHIYSYFAGASFMSEEWGMCNTFYDWKDFELSPYGKIKHKFIKFTEKYPGIGTPLTPIAVVLPKDLLVLDSVLTEDNVFVNFPITGSFASKINSLRAGLRKLFCESDSPHLGTESASLINCTTVDALDIVHEDKFNENDYDYFVDLTGSSEFAKKYSSRICDINDVPELLNKTLPCTFKGSAMKQLTKCSDGSHYILLTNNNGVIRSVEKGEILLSEANSTVTITPKDDFSLTYLDGNSELVKRGNNYTVEIPAGGWFFGRLAK